MFSISLVLTCDVMRLSFPHTHIMYSIHITMLTYFTFRRPPFSFEYLRIKFKIYNIPSFLLIFIFVNFSFILILYLFLDCYIVFSLLTLCLYLNTIVLHTHILSPPGDFLSPILPVGSTLMWLPNSPYWLSFHTDNTSPWSASCAMVLSAPSARTVL